MCVYRKVASTYLNGNYYAKGLEAEEQTYDGSGNSYLETLNTYRLRDLGNGNEVAPETLNGNAVAIAASTFMMCITLSFIVFIHADINTEC